MSRYLDLTLDQGATFTQKVNYVDNNKANISLAGYNARAQMRRSQYSANAISITATVSDANNGEITLSLAANATAGLKPGRWYYDVEANTAADASVIRVREGIITVMPGVTGAMAYTVPSGTTTTNIPEGDNLYFTNARAQASIFNANSALILKNQGVIRYNSVNLVANGYAQMQWLDSANIDVNDPNGTSAITNWAYVESGGIYLETNVNSGSTKSWYFDLQGNLILPNGTSIRDIGSIGSNTTGLEIGNHGFTMDFGSPSNDWAIFYGANLIQFSPNQTFNVSFGEELSWQFANTGNITFPDGSIQSTAYTGAGSSANIGNVTFQDNFVIGTGVGQNYGLYLAAGSGQVANLQYLRLRGGDDDAHIHFDTGDTDAYDLYIGDDNKYVKLERGYNGNVIIASSSNYGITWKFDIHGILEVPTTPSGWGRISGDNMVIAGDKSYPHAAYLYIPNNADASNTSTGIYNASGNVEIGAGGVNYWKFTANGAFANPVITYSNLPPASIAGIRAFISDANYAASGNFGVVISGGGSNTVPVFSDGTNWRIG